jgi:D-lactate dehydrogenase
MRISFFEITEEEKISLSSAVLEHDCTFFAEKLTNETAHLAKDSEVVSVFVNSFVTKQTIDLIPNLKFISTRSTGFDHIDIAYAKGKGIVTSNVPSYGSRTVAEFTFALLLEISRKVSVGNRRLREGLDYNLSGLRGFDLCGKTIGVVGTGKIGKNVIKIAKGFDMKVIAFDAYPDLNFAKENNFGYMTLNELLSQSDIVTLHTPYNKDTHHLININTLKFFKKGLYIINTARGELIDNSALLEALDNGTIAGAGLDVLDGERALKEKKDDTVVLHEDRQLINMPQVIVTPHVAFSSNEAEAEILRVTADNIKLFIANTPQNTV